MHQGWIIITIVPTTRRRRAPNRSLNILPLRQSTNHRQLNAAVRSTKVNRVVFAERCAPHWNSIIIYIHSAFLGNKRVSLPHPNRCWLFATGGNSTATAAVVGFSPLYPVCCRCWRIPTPQRMSIIEHRLYWTHACLIGTYGRCQYTRLIPTHWNLCSKIR